MAKRKSKKKKRRSRTAGSAKPTGTGGRFSSIAEHSRRGNVLSSPLSALNLTQLSWMNDRVPEVLWMALLLSTFGRAEALARLRQVGARIKKAALSNSDLSQSGIAEAPPKERRQMVELICAMDGQRDAVRPLLLFDGVPARSEWRDAIGADAREEDWAALQSAVAPILFHQSDIATDCRWFCLLVPILQGKLLFPPHLASMAEEILGYPDVGVEGAVAATIRAAEMTLNMAASQERSPRGWPDRFWDECLRSSPCLEAPAAGSSVPTRGTTLDRVRDVRARLVEHEAASRTTSATDPKRETVFGTALYALAMLDELLRVGNATSISGRLLLRTLAEVQITLAYLLEKDDPQLWDKHRRYGSGQAKLNFLKLHASPPSSVDIKSLEALANEDVWQELVDVDLGHWAGLNLRQMSIEADEKKVYDRFYGWSSTYSHGQWSAVRNVAFQTCFNPLHRLHRIPTAARSLPDVLADAAELTDAVLDLVDGACPGYTPRTQLGGEEGAG